MERRLHVVKEDSPIPELDVPPPDQPEQPSLSDVGMPRDDRRRDDQARGEHSPRLSGLGRIEEPLRLVEARAGDIAHVIEGGHA